MKILFRIDTTLITVLHVPSDAQPLNHETPFAPGWYWMESSDTIDPDDFLGPFTFAGNAITDAIEKVIDDGPQTHRPATPTQPTRVASSVSVPWLLIAIAGAILGSLLARIAASGS